jgi:hypothetical protein
VRLFAPILKVRNPGGEVRLLIKEARLTGRQKGERARTGRRPGFLSEHGTVSKVSPTTLFRFSVLKIAFKFQCRRWCVENERIDR